MNKYFKAQQPPITEGDVINLIEENNQLIFKKIDECCDIKPSPTPYKPTCTVKRVCRRKLHRKYIAGTELINGFDVVALSNKIKPNNSVNKNRAVKKYYDQELKVEVLIDDLPKIIVGKGYQYPNGEIDCLIPRLYVDSKGKVIKPKQYWVGKKNNSVCYG